MDEGGTYFPYRDLGRWERISRDSILEYTKRMPPPCPIFYKRSMSHPEMEVMLVSPMRLTALIEIWAVLMVKFLAEFHCIENS